MSQKTKRYSDEFKKEVVEYSIEHNLTVRQVCQNFNISPASYYKWKGKLLGEKDGDGASSGSGDDSHLSKAALVDEIKRLQKELAKSQRREDILKKAALILGDLPQNNMR